MYVAASNHVEMSAVTHRPGASSNPASDGCPGLTASAIVACFDLVETVNFLVATYMYPFTFPVLFSLCVLATPIKWVIAILTFFTLISGIAAGFATHIKNST